VVLNLTGQFVFAADIDIIMAEPNAEVHFQSSYGTYRFWLNREFKSWSPNGERGKYRNFKDFLLKSAVDLGITDKEGTLESVFGINVEDLYHLLQVFSWESERTLSFKHVDGTIWASGPNAWCFDEKIYTGNEFGKVMQSVLGAYGERLRLAQMAKFF